MKRSTVMGIVVGLLAAGLAAPEAAAWSDRAKQAITGMALQVVKHQFGDVFRPGDSNYERDVIRGAADSDVILADLALRSDADVILAIGQQIELLRDARTYGAGSYFAYRMGVLAGVIADAMIPYGFAFTPEEERLQAQINADIDQRLDGFNFSDFRSQRVFIRDTREYFASHRSFRSDDRTIIANDYRTGRGYGGFLNQATPTYFKRAVHAVADTWFTILRREGDVTQARASDRSLAFYFVNEIEYLLNVKKNVRQADRAYANFEAVNPGLSEAYERIGDLYYNYGTPETTERGVHEWRQAHQIAGADRQRIAEKLSNHYIQVGQRFAEKYETNEREETDLPNALRAFENALDLNRTSAEAADLIQATNVAIQQRNQRLQLTVELIATGERIREEADRARVEGDFGNAIATYRQTLSFFEAVDDEFRDQARIADESVRNVNKDITDSIGEVLDRASDAVDQGEALREQHQYEQAIATFESIPNIVAVIPEDVSRTHLDDRDAMIALAQTKVADAKTAKMRYEQAQREQEAAAAGRPAPPQQPQQPAGGQGL